MGNAIVLTEASGLILMIVYRIFQNPILYLFGANDKVSELTRTYAKDYFQWIAVGIPFYMFGQGMNPIIRSDGSPRTAMVATLVGAVISSLTPSPSSCCIGVSWAPPLPQSRDKSSPQESHWFIFVK